MMALVDRAQKRMISSIEYVIQIRSSNSLISCTRQVLLLLLLILMLIWSQLYCESYTITATKIIIV